jgi:hypothetical protein
LGFGATYSVVSGSLPCQPESTPEPAKLHSQSQFERA